MQKGGAEHIHSHQLDDNPDLLQQASPQQRRKLLGNQLADSMADEGQAYHPPFDKELLQLDQWAFQAAQAVAALAGRILPLHPRRRRHLRRTEQLDAEEAILEDAADDDQSGQRAEDKKDKPTSEGTTGSSGGGAAPGNAKVVSANSLDEPPQFKHMWLAIDDNPGTWRCTSCGTVANTGMATTPSAQGCRGISIVTTAVGPGHSLVKYPPHPSNHDQSTCYACELCHRCATCKPVFSEACVGEPTLARTRGYRRLEMGKHPHPRWGNTIMFGAGQWCPYNVREAPLPQAESPMDQPPLTLPS